MRFTARRTLALFLIFVMLLAACQPASPTPTVTVRPPATATSEATEEAAATEEATEVATDEATEEATDEATEEATEEPVVVMAATTDATEEATADVVLAGEEATEAVVALEETEEVATEEATATEAPTATDEPTATAEPTEAPTATDEPTATAEPTEAPTATDEPTATVEPTEAPTATDEPTEEATVEATEEGTPEATAELGTIAEIAAEGEDFSILLALVEAADLTDALNGDGPLTVFAPTDEAFEALFDELKITQDDLEENEDLANILLYHVVAGVIPSDTLVTLIERQDDSTLTVETLLEDETLEFTVEDGKVTINRNAEVSIADVRATNGVIHVIDAVLIPEGVTLGE